jgi:hypothetical protein
MREQMFGYIYLVPIAKDITMQAMSIPGAAGCFGAAISVQFRREQLLTVYYGQLYGEMFLD